MWHFTLFSGNYHPTNDDTYKLGQKRYGDFGKE